jgi:two-component system chemotaxis sensor kinase CheA
MDMNEYLPMFLAECREHLQELNLAVVRLEEHPDDRATIDEIFRAAHSLKGMSSTMGFEGTAHLTHQMEDVFELLRQRGGVLQPVVVDVVLECLDALGGAVDAIDRTGAEEIDASGLVAKLKALVRTDDDADGTAQPDGDAREAVKPVVLADGERVVELVVTLADDAVMPSVRALMVLQALGELGTVVTSTPPEAQLDGFTGKHVRASVVTAAEEDALVAAAKAVDDVAAVEVAEPEAVKTPAAPVTAGTEVPKKLEAVATPEERRGKGSSTVRVDAERLDQLMHLMGELVVQRTAVEALALDAGVPGLVQAVQELTRSSQALQAQVMQIRMIPVEAVFMRFPRLVRDVSTKLGKQVDLQVVGQETELDRTVVDALGDPLVHLIRNSLDHGLEPPQERVAAGKPQTGTLLIAARHAGGSIVITVRDDGRGVDPAKVGARAVERGLITPEQAAALDAAAAVELLFAPGFSTAESVGDLSGRGVGMDAVRAKIRELGGEVSVTSVPGEGTVNEIRLPLTLAIMSALVVEADGRPYGIPLNRVQRTMRLADQVVRQAAGRRMLMLDDEAIPLKRARDEFGHVGGVSEDDTHVVVVLSAERRMALSVSKLVGQVELVTRPLPPGMSGASAVSGAAVLSNGDIVLLADCEALIRATAPAAAETPRKAA